MNLTLSVSLFTDMQARVLTTGPLAAAQWVLVSAGSGSFDIQASRGNGAAPPLDVPDSDLIAIGTYAGWSFASAAPGSLRILQALSNSSAPALSVADPDLILIGTSF